MSLRPVWSTSEFQERQGYIEKPCLRKEGGRRKEREKERKERRKEGRKKERAYKKGRKDRQTDEKRVLECQAQWWTTVGEEDSRPRNCWPGWESTPNSCPSFRLSEAT